MNKQIKKQLAPLCILVSVIIFAAVLFFTVKPLFESFSEAKTQRENAEREEKELAEKDRLLKEEAAKEEMRLKAIKPIYQSDLQSDAENLGMFGSMFEDIIRRVQYNGLYIRSIEYDLKPASDLLFQKFAEEYNVCELKFFLVGTYAQLQSFLVELNNTFPYLSTVSALDVAAFSENTDYILINMSITLYSKKPAKK